MPPRGSFSIRKLFSSPRRLSHIPNHPAVAAHPSPSLDRFQQNSNSSSSSSANHKDDPRDGASPDSDDGLLLHPDSSITTPQAERGLVDVVAHELSQEEIDRIKAVVAAAAAAAATSLRLRMQADDQAEDADADADPVTATATATVTATATATAPEPLRKKSRRIPQPIVVPPRSLSWASGTRADRCCSCRHHQSNTAASSAVAKSAREDCKEDDAHPPSSLQPLSEGGAAACCEPLKAVQPQPPLAVAGNSNNTNSTSKSADKGDARRQRELGEGADYGSSHKDGSCDRKQVKQVEQVRQVRQVAPSLALPLPLSPPASLSSAASITPLTKPACLDSTLLGSLPPDSLPPDSLPPDSLSPDSLSPDSADLIAPPLDSSLPSPPLSSSLQPPQQHRHFAHRSVPVFDPPPTLHHKRPSHITRTSLPVTPRSPSSTPLVSSPLASSKSSISPPLSAAPRLSSIFSARRRDAPQPAARVVSRSKSRTRLRSKKSQPGSLRKPKVKARPPSPSQTQPQPQTQPRPQTQTQTQALAQEASAEELDPELLIHPVYRGQYAQPDGKKDSGISLHKDQPSLALSSIDKETLLNSTDDREHDRDDDDDDDSASEVSYSDASSCLDLLQALSIQPEEALQLQASEVANMPSLESARNDARVDVAPAPLSDGSTTPTFTRPRRAPSPAAPPVPPAHPLPHPSSPTPPPIRSPSLPMTPPYSPPVAKAAKAAKTAAATAAAAAPSSPAMPVMAKKQTRFLPALRLTKGSPAPVARKRSKKASSRKRAAAAAAKAASKKAPLPSGSHVDIRGSSSGGGGGGGGNSSSSRWALPDNVTELLTGRLFNRMEVTETISFEKLQAIQESRALAERLQHEREAKETLQREAQAQEDQQQQQQRAADNKNKLQEAQLADAEQALRQELERPAAADPALPPVAECSEEDDDGNKKRKHAVDTHSSVKKTKKDMDDGDDEDELAIDELQVSPLEPDAPSAAGDGLPGHVFQEQLVDITVSPTSPTSPTLPTMPLQSQSQSQSQHSSYNDPATRVPPLQPLPPPPHIASQMMWQGADAADAGRSAGPRSGETVSTKLLIPGAAEPDGSVTPLEPFHMQDLPRRIDAASVRVSILLPVEEEEAYFASSVAEHKERRRREREEREREEAEAAQEVQAAVGQPETESELALRAEDPCEQTPSPPSKNPLRFSLQDQPPQPPATIPQLTVTDVDSHGQPSFTVTLPSSPRSPRPPPPPVRPKTPKTSKTSKTPKSAKDARPRSSRSASSIPSSSMAATPQRDEETYVYLPATPFSLVMPSFRHGPVRLLRPEQDSLFLSGGDGMPMSASPISPRRKHMAAVDDTLDWTAFQMAILGGAGDFFQDSVDFGHTSAAEADEVDSLSEWYLSMGFHQERLLRNESEDPTAAAVQPAVQATASPAPAPSLTKYQHGHWASFGSASDSNYDDRNARHSGQSNKSSSSAQSMQSTQSLQSSLSNQTTSTRSRSGSRFVDSVGAFYGMHGPHTMTNVSLPVRFSDHFSIDAGSVSSANSADKSTTTGTTADTANLASTARLEMPASRTPSPSLYSRRIGQAGQAGPVEILGAEIPGELQGSEPGPARRSKHRRNTASCASFDSYESMPQSPMADLVMTRGADGKEYVAPMGYNLGHDLGDFLRWETENVYALDGRE